MKRMLSNARHQSSLMTFLAAAWDWLVQHRDAVTTVDALVAGAFLMWTSRRNPVEERRRFRARPDADPAERAAEIFGRAVEQLASDRLDIRLGGIYTL